MSHEIKRATRAYMRFVTVAGAILGVFLIAMLYAFLRPYDNISFTPFQTDKAEYYPGDVITLTNQFCWDGTPFNSERFFQSQVSRISAGSVEFPNGFSTSKALQEKFGQGECAESQIRVEVPTSIPPGEWAVAYDVTYQPNLVRTVAISNVSNTFVVLPAPEGE